ncbi:unnamed protein product [Dibothriocephalus latus]|uniref:Uncharacterized protein n=1 Tax=Dibothriocephalus latus TaxID=60516 RepID=A0A3P6RK13_DIBLA|nr:unnamed protein product [Dibothriocephalus latus]
MRCTSTRQMNDPDDPSKLSLEASQVPSEDGREFMGKKGTKLFQQEVAKRAREHKTMSEQENQSRKEGAAEQRS